MALFVLRQREPDAARPFKALGYPIAPAIFAVASVLIVANALYSDLVVPLQRGTSWGPAAAGIIIIALGVPLYYFFKRRAL
jgi:APA family basic amino acid/polyamine antiporter